MTWRLAVLLSCVTASASASPPTVTHLFPAGGSRGNTIEVTATGKFDPWPTPLWVSRPGLTVTPGKESGSYKVAVAADAEPGVYWLRAHNADGASPLRPFVVGTLPEVSEAEPNDEPTQAKAIDTPGVVVNGRLTKGDTDCFAVVLKQGQTLVASVEAHATLKSPIDAVLQVVSPGGFVVEQNHDRRGLDPQLVFTAPTAGTYVVRLFAFPATPDSSIRLFGSEACVYRLTLTTAGFADFATPLAVAPEGGTVSVTGWNVPEAARRLTVPKGEPGPVDLFHPLLANTVRVRREAGAVTGRLEKAGVPFGHVVAGKKGQPLAVRAESRGFGLDVNPVIRVTDAGGKQLARAEPAKLHTDTGLSFTPPADGAYKLLVTDLYGFAGPRSAFLLSVAPPMQDYDLTVPADRVAVPPSKTTDVAVKVTRRNGFTKPVEVTAEGLPDGVTVTSKADAATVTLTLSAGKAGVSGAFRLVGRVAGEPDLTRLARAPNGEFDEPTADLWVAVSDTPVSPAAPKKK